jgi:hypothetical protein
MNTQIGFPDNTFRMAKTSPHTAYIRRSGKPRTRCGRLKPTPDTTLDGTQLGAEANHDDRVIGQQS